MQKISRYHGIRVINRTNQPTPTRNAMYLPKSHGGPQIRLYPRFYTQSKPRQESILEHEYSHYVYFELLTPQEIRLWEAVSNFELGQRVKALFKGRYKNAYINSHAAKFPSEDFSEMWEDYILNKRARKFGDYLDIKMQVMLHLMKKRDPRKIL